MNAFEEIKPWFYNSLKPAVEKNFEVKIVDEKNGDLGDLIGIQLDNGKLGGYAYYWSHGYASYELFDYINDIDIVNDTTEKVTSDSPEEIFSKLLIKLDLSL